MKMLPLYLIGSLWIASLAATFAADTNSVKIGVYDSRAVAYAHFWSPPAQKEQKEKVAAAQAARKAGDLAKLKEYDAVFQAHQAEMHRMVFSTAPAIPALEAIKERIPAIQKEMGVSILVSKWDEKSLKDYAGATRVDVTDNLVREFLQPDEKQAKIIESIQKQKPIPLDKCNELIRKGEI